MFEFFIALFGGLFYGVKGFNERCETNRYKNLKETCRQVDDIVTNPDFEHKSHPKGNKEAWEMLLSIQDDIEEIFGEQWMSLFKKYDYYSIKQLDKTPGHSGFCQIWRLAFEVWLSNRGYIPWLRDYYDTKFYFREAEQEELDVRAINLRTCKIIERNMQANHPTLPLRLWVSLDTEPTVLRWEHRIRSYDGTLLRRLW